MAAVASNNRAASATFLLALILTSSWCMASAVPAANGRRLQQLATLQTRLQALADGVTDLSIKVQSSLLAISSSVSADLLSQLENVEGNLKAGATQLQASVQVILGLPTTVLATAQVQTTFDGLLSEFEADLQTCTTLLQGPAPVAGGCYTSLQVQLVAAINKLAADLQAAAAVLVPAELSVQVQALVTPLLNIGVAVNQVNACDPGLQVLLANDQIVITAITQLAISIQA